jgi:hypothetical protein
MTRLFGHSCVRKNTSLLLLTTKSYLGVILVFLILGGASMAQAQSLEWDHNGIAQSGIWDTTHEYWWNGSSYVAWPTSAGYSNDAIFDSSSDIEKATIYGTVIVDDISFYNGSYIIQGDDDPVSPGEIQLYGSPSFTTNGSITATIESRIKGDYGLTKAGEGTLILSGANNPYNSYEDPGEVYRMDHVGRKRLGYVQPQPVSAALAGGLPGIRRGERIYRNPRTVQPPPVHSRHRPADLQETTEEFNELNLTYNNVYHNDKIGVLLRMRI